MVQLTLTQYWSLTPRNMHGYQSPEIAEGGVNTRTVCHAWRYILTIHVETCVFVGSRTFPLTNKNCCIRFREGCWTIYRRLGVLAWPRFVYQQSKQNKRTPFQHTVMSPEDAQDVRIKAEIAKTPRYDVSIFDTPFSELPDPKRVWIGEPGSRLEELGKSHYFLSHFQFLLSISHCAYPGLSSHIKQVDWLS